MFGRRARRAGYTCLAYLAPAMASARTLSEHASKALLAEYGVPIAAERLVSSADEARAAAAQIGFPVVVKLCGDAIAHKTERRLVRLGLGDPGHPEQKDEEEQRHADRDPAVRRRERDHRPRHPVQPLEEVVRVP